MDPAALDLALSDYLSVASAARLAGVSHTRITALVTTGKLPALTIDGRRFVHRADVANRNVPRGTLAGLATRPLPSPHG